MAEQKTTEEEVFEFHHRVHHELARDETGRSFATRLQGSSAGNSVFVGANRDSTVQSLFSKWAEARRTPGKPTNFWSHEARGKGFKNCMIVTRSQEMADRLNDWAQERRGAELGRSLKIGKERIHEGDRILFPDGDRTHDIKKNEMGTVLSVNPFPLFKEVTVQLDSGEQLTFSTREKIAVTRAYATTPDRVEDKTFAQTFVFLHGPRAWHDVTAVLNSRYSRSAAFFADRETVTQPMEHPLMLQQKERRTPTDYVGYLFDLERERVDGNLNLNNTRQEAREAAVDAWFDRASRNPSALMITQTRQEAETLNRMVQERRAEAFAGRSNMQVGNERVYEGERVIATADSAFYHKGQVATVLMVHPRTSPFRTIISSVGFRLKRYRTGANPKPSAP